MTSELLISAPISQRVAPLQCGHVLPGLPAQLCWTLHTARRPQETWLARSLARRGLARGGRPHAAPWSLTDPGKALEERSPVTAQQNGVQETATRTQGEAVPPAASRPPQAFLKNVPPPPFLPKRTLLSSASSTCCNLLVLVVILCCSRINPFFSGQITYFFKVNKSSQTHRKDQVLLGNPLKENMGSCQQPPCLPCPQVQCPPHGPCCRAQSRPPQGPGTAPLPSPRRTHCPGPACHRPECNQGPAPEQAQAAGGRARGAGRTAGLTPRLG